MPRQQRIDPRTVSHPKKKGNKSGRPGGRPGTVLVHKARARDWIAGARPLTLALAIAPVALGTGAAYVLGHEDDGPGWHWLRALMCLAVAVFLQIGVNFANDYSDGVRGTDAHRVGPMRLTASGAAKPRTVLTVALVFFGLAAVTGLVIVFRSGHWWLLALGAAAILAAWFYTGGKRPYGYYGLGELFVFLFFGLAATAGTTYVLADTVSVDSWLAGVAIGFIACAVLMINNLRDRTQDKLAGKRTIAALIGDLPSRIAYSVLVLAPFVVLIYFALLYEWAYLVFFALLIAIPAVVITITAKTPKEFVLVLKLTTLLAIAFGLGLAAAIAF